MTSLALSPSRPSCTFGVSCLGFEGEPVPNKNQNNRMVQAVEGGVLGNYGLNASEQRTTKTIGGVTTVYHYDVEGRLIAEGQGGITTAEYIHLDGQPLARADGVTLSSVHTDHLGTPVSMSNGTGATSWSIQTRPFGDGATIAGTATLNFRFPGQYADGETGLSQNWWREYDSRVGRFLSQDPADYHNGVSGYAYALGRPTVLVDPSGLTSCNPGCSQNVKQGKANLCNFAQTIANAAIRQCIQNQCNLSSGTITCDQNHPYCAGGSPGYSLTTSAILLCPGNTMPPGACWKRVIAHEMWVHQCTPGGPAQPNVQIHLQQAAVIKKLVTCP